MTLGIDPATTAAKVVTMLREGHFAELQQLFIPSLRKLVSADVLRAAWVAELDRNGPFSAAREPVSEPAGAEVVLVTVPVAFERGELTVLMSVDNDSMLTGLRFAPGPVTSWTPPSYATPEMFSEQEIVLGEAPLAVPGTLTMPNGDGPHPGVVLLSGGAPFDRDETSGPNKPLKDLAWGLASQGVAVLRFDKATYTHGHAAAGPGFTMTREYLPHAIAAIHLLQQQKPVDPARVFVLGHSMGGKVAPRVAAAETSVAGLVILAGDAQPMHQAAVRVARHLASLAPGSIDDATLDTITRQAAVIDSPGLSASTPPEDLLFGYPASYWLDMRAYDPVAAMATIGKPAFILQGGRDYQVTVDDDLARWQAGLAHRTDVTIRVYDADNHLFFPGTGPSTPAEYETPHHVDPDVITDIADWLTQTPCTS